MFCCEKYNMLFQHVLEGKYVTEEPENTYVQAEFNFI